MNLQLLNVFVPRYLQKLVVICGLTGIPISVYFSVFYDPKPTITISEFEPAAPFIKAESEASVLWLQIENKGNAPLLPNMYDSLSPPTIVMQGADIDGEVLLFEQNSNAQPLKLESTMKNSVTFSMKLIETGTILLLRIPIRPKEGGRYDWSLRGNIMGDLIVLPPRDAQSSLLHREILDHGNNYGIYLVRWLIYSIPISFLILLFALVIRFLTVRIRPAIKDKYINEFKKKNQNSIIPEHEAIFDLYRKSGPDGLFNIVSMFANGEHFLRIVNSPMMYDPVIVSNQIPIGLELSSSYPYFHLSFHEMVAIGHYLMFIRCLKKDTDGQYKFWKPMYDTFLEFGSFISKKSKRFNTISKPPEPDFVANDA